MKKKESVRLTLEQLDQEAQKEQAEKERVEMEKKQDNARPSLIKRMGIGLLDFLFAALLAGSCFLFTYFVLFNPLGYNAAAETIVNKHNNSGLFVINNGSWAKLSSKYEESKNPVEYYDIPLTSYYSTDARAIEEHKLDTYIQSKLDSGYFVMDADNKCVPKEGIGTLVLKETLEREYEKAYDFFYEDPALEKASKTTYYVITLSILVCVTIGSIVMYIIIPLTDKQNRTLGYKISGVLAVNKDTMAPISRKRSLLRSVLYILITFISPVTLYVLTGVIFYSTIPIFVNTLFLCLLHSNSGLHDLVGECTVINKTHSNAMSVLETVKEMGEQQ